MYVPEKEALIWKIKSFPGGREFLLRCKFGLPSVAAEEEAHGRMPPMRVSFEIPYFTVSGIQALFTARAGQTEDMSVVYAVYAGCVAPSQAL